MTCTRNADEDVDVDGDVDADGDTSSTGIRRTSGCGPWGPQRIFKWRSYAHSNFEHATFAVSAYLLKL